MAGCVTVAAMATNGPRGGEDNEMRGNRDSLSMGIIISEYASETIISRLLIDETVAFQESPSHTSICRLKPICVL